MNAEAKYKELFRTLRMQILSGGMDDRERFPSEVQLMRKYHVSRNTVRAALEELKRSGMIETRNGAGTFLTTAARRATGLLGIIVPGIASGEIFPRICTEFTRLARDEGYTTIFGDASSSDPLVRDTQALRLAHDYVRKNVAGVLFEPLELTPNAQATTADIIHLLDSHRIPVVLIDRDIASPSGRSKYDLVGIDNIRAGHQLASHVIESGAKNIHVLIRPGSAPTVFKRAQGVRNAVLDAGLKWGKKHIHVEDPADLTAVKKQLVAAKADAIVCGNDSTAAKLLETLRHLRIAVPDDIMVTGVDDVRLASAVTPHLTTLRQPCEQLAEAAFSMLIQRIRNPHQAARETLLDVEIIVRGSTVKQLSRLRPLKTRRSAHGSDL